VRPLFRVDLNVGKRGLRGGDFLGDIEDAWLVRDRVGELVAGGRHVEKREQARELDDLGRWSLVAGCWGRRPCFGLGNVVGGTEELVAIVFRWSRLLQHLPVGSQRYVLRDFLVGDGGGDHAVGGAFKVERQRGVVARAAAAAAGAIALQARSDFLLPERTDFFLLVHTVGFERQVLGKGGSVLRKQRVLRFECGWRANFGHACCRILAQDDSH
jgi:hypothetical protein